MLHRQSTEPHSNRCTSKFFLRWGTIRTAPTGRRFPPPPEPSQARLSDAAIGTINNPFRRCAPPRISGLAIGQWPRLGQTFARQKGESPMGRTFARLGELFSGLGWRNPSCRSPLYGHGNSAVEMVGLVLRDRRVGVYREVEIQLSG